MTALELVSGASSQADSLTGEISLLKDLPPFFLYVPPVISGTCQNLEEQLLALKDQKPSLWLIAQVSSLAMTTLGFAQNLYALAASDDLSALVVYGFGYQHTVSVPLSLAERELRRRYNKAP